jgi:hypothetical protein
MIYLPERLAHSWWRDRGDQVPALLGPAFLSLAYGLKLNGTHQLLAYADDVTYWEEAYIL